MCELLAMCSLQPARLTLFREPTAAGDSPLVKFLESHGPRSTMTIAHNGALGRITYAAVRGRTACRYRAIRGGFAPIGARQFPLRRRRHLVCARSSTPESRYRRDQAAGPVLTSPRPTGRALLPRVLSSPSGVLPPAQCLRACLESRRHAALAWRRPGCCYCNGSRLPVRRLQ